MVVWDANGMLMIADEYTEQWLDDVMAQVVQELGTIEMDECSLEEFWVQ
jgi:hypothetical protein